MAFMDEPAMLMAQERSQLWGASLFSYPERDAAEWLSLLAEDGVRAWVTPARSGANGYFALIVHPDDAAFFESGPILSGGRPSLQRQVGGRQLRLCPFWRSDFSAQAESVADNVTRAEAIALARQEREELGRLGLEPPASSSSKGRL